MTSLVLSFVGNQDPFSNNSNKEGSIVALIHHLMQMKCHISKVILLYTADTEQGAVDTHDWLKLEPLSLKENSIELVPVSKELSTDPVNLLLAVQEARKGIDIAAKNLFENDFIEFNASSGTPVMKCSWSILQAAGYAPKSRIWQVRNPEKIGDEQVRVFQTNVDTLKHEFDIKIVKHQVCDYNYSGAQITLEESGILLESDPSAAILRALLGYGHCRSAFDFDHAYSHIQGLYRLIDKQLWQDICALRQRSLGILSRECYFIALARLKNKEYADFLVLLSSFLENSLRYFIEIKTNIDLMNNNKDQISKQIKAIDHGRLYAYLEKYRLKNGGKLNLKEVNKVFMEAIIEYYPDFSDLVPSLDYLRVYVKIRNAWIHRLEGVSEIPEENTALDHMRKILKKIIGFSKKNPYDDLNNQICSYLDGLFHLPKAQEM